MLPAIAAGFSAANPMNTGIVSPQDAARINSQNQMQAALGQLHDLFGRFKTFMSDQAGTVSQPTPLRGAYQDFKELMSGMQTDAPPRPRQVIEATMNLLSAAMAEAQKPPFGRDPLLPSMLGDAADTLEQYQDVREHRQPPQPDFNAWILERMRNFMQQPMQGSFEPDFQSGSGGNGQVADRVIGMLADMASLLQQALQPEDPPNIMSAF